ncbi:unnamed protein product [Rotaria sp. Silwood2]|nr:unnamed protein product [Rotaria sp. Silwood2]CAF3286060.1 unnamed protein product [Rotaria sp. Silwood2]CAF4362024.1 unnamed protein product [Rotaria sp. Silwood2]
MQFGIISLMLLLIGPSEGFFNGDLSTVRNKTLNRLNLTCRYDDSLLTNSEYCVYQSFSNGSSLKTLYDFMRVTNTYKITTERCTGFSNTVDIGFGLCLPLQFELFDISILCICATNMCNMNFTSCQSSVTNQLQINSAPSVLSSMVPELNTQISCYDSADSYKTSFYCANFASPYIDIQKCNDYTMKNTLVCMYQTSSEGEFFLAVTVDIYKYYLSGALYRVYQFNQESSTTLAYNETSSSFYINYILRYLDGNKTVSLNIQRCFCTQSYCNYNLTTCLSANGTTTPISMGNSVRSKLLNNYSFHMNSFFSRKSKQYHCFPLVLSYH